jgi:hypothetical protein
MFGLRLGIASEGCRKKIGQHLLIAPLVELTRHRMTWPAGRTIGPEFDLSSWNGFQWRQ